VKLVDKKKSSERLKKNSSIKVVDEKKKSSHSLMKESSHSLNQKIETIIESPEL